MDKKGKLGSMIKAGDKAKAPDANENGISENGAHSKEDHENDNGDAELSEKGDSPVDGDSSPEDDGDQGAKDKKDAEATDTPKKKSTKAEKSGEVQKKKKQPPKLSLKTKKSKNEGDEEDDDDEVKTSIKDMRYYDDEGKPIPRELQLYFGGTREQMDREYCDSIFPDTNMGRLIKSVLYQVVADDRDRFPNLHASLKPEVDEDGDVVSVGETIKITNEAYELLHGAAEEHLRRVFKVADGLRQADSVAGLTHVHLRASANIDLLQNTPESRFNFKDHKKGFLIRTKRRTMDLNVKKKRFIEMNSMPLKDYLIKYNAPEATMTEEEIYEKEKDTYTTHTLKRKESPLGSSVLCKTFVYEEPMEESAESEESDEEEHQSEPSPAKSTPKKSNTNAKKTPVKKEPVTDKKSVTFKKVKKEKVSNKNVDEEEEEKKPATPKKKPQAKPKPAQKRKASEIEKDEEEEQEEKPKKKAKKN